MNCENCERLEHDLMAVRARYDAACAVLRAPSHDNDGGPADLAEEIRTILHNWNDAEERAAAALRTLFPIKKD